jgi:murein DD-endopeptidase MepM/ murein hydrolase activator NlpD
MWSFIADLLQNTGTEHTVLVMDAAEADNPRRYRIWPSRLLLGWGISLLGMSVIVAALIVFTPLRTQIPGYGTEKIAESARLNALRVQALQDSLRAQRDYIRRLRGLITGRIDSVGVSQPSSSSAPRSSGAAPGQASAGGRDGGGGAHAQPALQPRVRMAAHHPGGQRLGGLAFPLTPPVANGFPTRDFDAQAGHYGIDVAVPEGEFIRAVGAGYVVWADWTQDGGYTIAVQHADGYLSVYKHNKRLLKQLGDRVRAQDPLAVSGNTGAITTGPHLHFEFWRNGLAQGPQSYIAGW